MIAESFYFLSVTFQLFSVVFYYAGHGCFNNGVDYMIPTDAKGHEEYLEEGQCVTSAEVINTFQKCDPALLFYVHDTCRGTANVM